MRGVELLRFFDHYLVGLDTGLEREEPVHYFTMIEERWRATSHWPPHDRTTQLFFAGDGRLVAGAGAAGEDRYRVDFALATGPHTRYGRLAAFDVRDYYIDWNGRDTRMLCYTSEPLAADHELSGHPCVTLHLSASEADAALHVYLEDVAPDGTAFNLMSPGLDVLRASHRNSKIEPELLMPGKIYRLDLNRMLTSNTFLAGHHIRVQISAAFMPHFSRNLQCGESELTSSESCVAHIRIHHDKEHASRIILPVISH